LLLLESFDPVVLDGDTVDDLLFEDVGAAEHIAFLDFLPVVVGSGGLVEVFVDGSAGQIVADGDLAVGSGTADQRIDLLVGAYGKRDIPVILAIYFVDGAALVILAGLFLGDEIF